MVLLMKLRYQMEQRTSIYWMPEISVGQEGANSNYLKNDDVALGREE